MGEPFHHTINPEQGEELVVECRQIKGVLLCVLHTIIFNRALGTLLFPGRHHLHVSVFPARRAGIVEPEEVESSLLDDVMYVKCKHESTNGCPPPAHRRVLACGFVPETASALVRRQAAGKRRRQRHQVVREESRKESKPASAGTE